MKVYVILNHLSTPDECNIVDLEVALSLDDAKQFVKKFHEKILDEFVYKLTNDDVKEYLDDEYEEGCEDYITVIDSPSYYIWNHVYIVEKEV